MEKINLSITSLAAFFCLFQMSCGGSGSSSNASSSDQILKVSEENATISSNGAGAKLDNSTELQTGFQGLDVENVYIVDGNDKRLSGSVVALNTKFSIVHEGVKNYTLKNSKAFPSLSLVVNDDNGNMIISEADVYASYTDGLSEADASVLRATVNVGEPMKPGKYNCAITVLDKNNSNASIMTTWEFEVK